MQLQCESNASPHAYGERLGEGHVASQQIDNYAVKREQSYACISYAKLTNE